MFSDTPMVVQVLSPLVVSMSTLVTAAVPWRVSRTRTLKSVRCRRSSWGNLPSRTERRAASRALTGPFPRPVASNRSSPTWTFTVASVSTSTATSFHARLPLPDRWPTLTEKDSRVK